MKTRVAIVTTVLPEYKVHLYARLARRADWDLMLWHGPGREDYALPDADPGEAFAHRSARNIHVKAGLPLVWQRVRRELWDFRPQVIVLDEFVRVLSHWPLLVEAWRRGVPVIFYGHGENRERLRSRGRLLGEAIERVRRMQHRLASGVIVYTERSAAAYRLAHPHTPCFVAGNTLDSDALVAELARLPRDHAKTARAHLGVPDGALLVASVGRLVTQHDPRPLIDAAQTARARGGNPHLLVIGSGPLEAVVRRHLAALPEDEQRTVHFQPRLPLLETTRWLAACDAFVSPGTVGLSIVHAMLAGLPFVARGDLEHGPEIDYLEHGRNGVLLPGCGEPMAEALLRLEHEPDWRRELGKNGREYARTRLTPERQAQGFVDAVEHALRRRDASRPRFARA